MSSTNELTPEDLERFIKQSFTLHHLPLDRCSQVLLSQLARMPDYGGINYPFQFVEHEIAHLEGWEKTQTKPATKFKKSGKLCGFMHKHFFVPGYGHFGENVMNAWALNRQNSNKFSEMAIRVAKPYTSEGQNTLEELWKYSGEVAREVIRGEGGLEDRFADEQGTGDWLIFIPHEGKNYYLCIAKHNEDEFILGALKFCVLDFPFLEKILGSK